jgi:hypothetical protein
MIRTVALLVAGGLFLALLVLGPQLSYGMYGPLFLTPLPSALSPPPSGAKLVVGAWGGDDVTAPVYTMSAFEGWLGISAGSAHNLITICDGSQPGCGNPGLATLESYFSSALGSPAQNRPQTIGVQINDTAANIIAGAYGPSGDNFINDVATAINCCAGPNVSFRLDWEFNLPGNRWYIGGGGPYGYTGANFIQMWQYVIPLVRSYAPNVKISWNPSVDAPFGNVDPLDGYPGNAYVDIIAQDAYDTSSSGTTPTDIGNDWNNYWLGNASTGRGLAWAVAFAKANGKALAFEETASGNVSGNSFCTSAPTAADDEHGAGIVPYEAAWVKNTGNINGYEPYAYFHWWNSNLGGYCAIIDGGIPFNYEDGPPYTAATAPPVDNASQYQIPLTAQAFYTAFHGWQ